MLPTLPAESALSIPATRMCVDVLVNIIKAQMNRNVRPPRDATSWVRLAF